VGAGGQGGEHQGGVSLSESCDLTDVVSDGRLFSLSVIARETGDPVTAGQYVKHSLFRPIARWLPDAPLSRSMTRRSFDFFIGETFRILAHKFPIKKQGLRASHATAPALPERARRVSFDSTPTPFAQANRE
jgi:hypothetical protein